MKVWQFRFVAREGYHLIAYGKFEEYLASLDFKRRSDIRDLELKDVPE